MVRLDLNYGAGVTSCGKNEVRSDPDDLSNEVNTDRGVNSTQTVG